MNKTTANVTIPFVSQLPPDSEAEWLDTLTAAISVPISTASISTAPISIAPINIKPLGKMSAIEKQDAKLAIVANPKPEDLDELPALKCVHSVWAGVESLIPILKCRELQIIRLIDPELSATMAEAVLAWTLYIHRDMPNYARQQQKQCWRALDYVKSSNRTVGILGLGALGQQAANALLQNGFNVVAWSRTSKLMPQVRCYSGQAGLANLLQQSNILVCLLPLTEATKGLLDAQRLALLPPKASLINFSRGSIVKTNDLLMSLENHLQHAVLDVFEEEPLPRNDRLWSHPKITILPHISAPTDRHTASAIVARNISHYLMTGELPETVDQDLGY